VWPRDEAVRGSPCPRTTPPRTAPRWWGGLLLKELTAGATEELPYVNLSDGGHTGDNLGLYPLLQRRCALIFVVDGERDPEYRFGSLISAIRQIFTDENVRVDIQPDVIRKAQEGGGEPVHFALGRITYPDCREKDADAAEPAAEAYDPAAPSEGLLVYVKSSFFDREEPAGVKSYAMRHPEFPHESTADQFFDDDQFEAYRALGEHIGEALCRAIADRRALEALHEAEHTRVWLQEWLDVVRLPVEPT
jgi:hypothetical protein